MYKYRIYNEATKKFMNISMDKRIENVYQLEGRKFWRFGRLNNDSPLGLCHCRLISVLEGGNDPT